PTGAVVQSFLRLRSGNKSTVEQGYNTDARPLQFDESKSPKSTRSLKLADVPVVDVGGTNYRVFLLDVNQKSTQPPVSLDELRLYVGGAPDLTGYDEVSPTHRLAGLPAGYDLDASGDHYVALDSGDAYVYIPDGAFAGGGQYVYLYSKFGVHLGADSGLVE